MVAKSAEKHAETIELIAKSDFPIYHEMLCQFLCDGQIIDVLKVVAYDERDDYKQGFGGEIVITVSMILSDYMNKLYPSRNKLTCAITRYIKVKDEGVIQSRGVTTEYSVVPMDNTDLDASSVVAFDSTMEITQVSFQLIPLPLNQLSMETVSGIFYQEKALDILKVLLGNATKKYTKDLEHAFIGVTAQESPKEVRVKPQIIIKPIPILELPAYLQKFCGGIYNHDIGCFYKYRLWYVFPLYDTTRYERTKRVLDIAVLPPKETVGYDKTYNVINERVMVLITADFQEMDTRDIQRINQGNGVRFINATQHFESSATEKDNKTVANVTDNVAQFIVGERETGEQVAPFSDVWATDNVSREISKLSARAGTFVTMLWKYANPEVLYPGMPVKVLYPKNGEIIERTGTLLQTQTFGRTLQAEMTAKKLAYEIALLVFLGD